jgi:hypothetical protein
MVWLALAVVPVVLSFALAFLLSLLLLTFVLLPLLLLLFLLLPLLALSLTPIASTPAIFP